MDSPFARIFEIAEREEGSGKELLEQMAYNEKMAELGQLAVGLIHELNTPLSVINSAAQMILREECLSDFMKEMVERISLETHRLSQLSRGLLSFSRKEEGATGEVNVTQTIKDVTTFLRYEAQKRSILVVEDLDYRLPSVLADANHLKQALINLIMNALQAMENGGTLMIRTTMPSHTAVEIQIADTGPGIAPENVNRIFEPFYTTKGPSQGTGLGLFITRKLVEQYGGGIRVKSIPEEGTTFFITLPLSVSADSEGEIC